MNELAEELEALLLPDEKATDAELTEFGDGLRAITIKHRDVGREWDLTLERESRLVNYLIATRLLQDCLELATMPPDEKKAMLNSLYLPPAQREDKRMLEAGDD